VVVRRPLPPMMSGRNSDHQGLKVYQ